jgi:hypothetical protein
MSLSEVPFDRLRAKVVFYVIALRPNQMMKGITLSTVPKRRGYRVDR